MSFSFQVWWAFLCVCECTDLISCYCFDQESLAVSSSCTRVKLLGVVCHVKPERPPCNICIKPCCSFIICAHIVRVFSCGKCCSLFWPHMSSCFLLPPVSCRFCCVDGRLPPLYLHVFIPYCRSVKLLWALTGQLSCPCIQSWAGSWRLCVTLVALMWNVFCSKRHIFISTTTPPPPPLFLPLLYKFMCFRLPSLVQFHSVERGFLFFEFLSLIVKYT